jgi:hypothetical protein
MFRQHHAVTGLRYSFSSGDVGYNSVVKHLLMCSEYGALPPAQLSLFKRKITGFKRNAWPHQLSEVSLGFQSFYTRISPGLYF